MPSLSSKELKAIHWYLQEHPALRLSLSLPPNIFFKNDDGVEIRISIHELVGMHEIARREDAKERARSKERV